LARRISFGKVPLGVAASRLQMGWRHDRHPGPGVIPKVQPAHIIINSDNIWTFIFEKSCCTVRYGNVAWSTGRRQLLTAGNLSSLNFV
jgi:hypothetical protein